MRTKQEIIDFLESKVGTKVKCIGNPSLDGQCVTLIKSLMEFLGVPEPYKARGNAKDCIAKYLSEGIAKPGLGFMSVFSNKVMASGVGHIWCNAGEGDGTYYESNGAKPLIVTKGKTYSYDNVCNFDSYLQGGSMANMYGNPALDLSNAESMKICVDVYNDVMHHGVYVTADKANESMTAAYDRGLAEGKASVVAGNSIDLNKYTENGLTVETTNGNTKTIVNYKLK